MMDIPDHAPSRQHKTGPDGPDLFEDLMGKQRREQPQDSIFADNPFVDGFFEWMGSPEGQQRIEIHDVLWDLLADVQLDAKQRKLIWPDAERLDLEQSIQRVQKKYPNFPCDEVEEFLLDWIDMATIRKTTPKRNSTSLTPSQSDGSPTISEQQRPQKNRKELGTLELLRVRLKT
jgi:hypothetical protein